MIRVVVLGTTAALPTKRSHTTCIAVRYGGDYLFDCCEGCQRQMMKHGISPTRVNAVFVTHLHADHFLGLFGLVQTMGFQGRAQPLLIVGPKGTKSLLSTVFALKPLSPAFPIEYKEISRAGTVYKNELFGVKAFPVKHTAKAYGYVLEAHAYRRFDEAKAKSLGVRGRMFTELQENGVVTVDGKKIRYADVTYLQPGKKLVYTGDTAPCPAITRNAAGADLLVHEASFLSEQKGLAAEKLHSTAAQAAKDAASAKAKKLMLIHFSNRYEDKRPLLEEAKKVFDQTILAEEGLEVMI